MADRAESRNTFRAPWSLFWAAFAVRVIYVTVAHTYRIRSYDDHMLFGEEMGRIARALATGYGFADPFRGHTGPTAWVGPLFPLLLSGVFRVFGVFSPASAWVILACNSFFSALDSPERVGNRCPLLRPKGGALVRLDLGVVPRCHAICRPLAFGIPP